jgi:hypothetical protein
MALVLGACGTGTEEPSASPGVPPERIGATGARCPDEHPIPTLRGVAFPPGHPDAPVLEPRPDRCFRSLREAERAGFPTADAPPGSRLIGDIYLVPVDRDLRADCRRAARSIHRPVACPALLPSGGALLPSIERGSAVFEGGFPLPEGHDPEAESHLWVITTPPALAREIEGCSVVLGTTSTTIRGRPATFTSCGEASERHGGHVIVVWEEAGGSHAVSLHGVTAGNRRLVRAIAGSVELIRPQ